jgi:YidC/Oxa1 family membrane protein insertase
MDWKTWAAVGLSIIGLFLWQFFYAQNLTPPPEVPAAAAAETKPETGDPDVASAQATDQSEAVPTPAATPASTPVVPVMAARSEAIAARDAEYIFNNDTGGIEEVRLLQHLGENKEVIYLNRDRKMPIGAIGLEPGEAVGGFHMEMEREAGRVVFSKAYPDGLVVRKIFTLPSAESETPQFTVDLRLEFENTGEAEVQRLGYFVSAGGAAPVHVTDLPIYTRFDWHRESKMQSIDVNWFSPGTIPLIGIQTRGARDYYSEARDRIDWVGVASQYFCTVVTSPEARGLSVWARRFDTKKQNDTPVYGIQGAMGMPGFRLAPGEKAAEVFQIYAGPKDFSLLQAMPQGQVAIMNFGMFGLVSEVLLWAMNALYGLVGNYAAAIIILTLIIKSILWPIQNKSTESMRRMSLLSPKMTELREKYKDNPQKMNEELMKLYKDYGINPFSGCIPLFIQIPIFFGFYSMLGVAIELRNASFFWIQDLSQPDTVGYVMGFPINLLPIIMAITMVWQIAITPKTGDKMQTRIFYIMPVVFLAFCYNFASALALYWTTQNIFSIVQLYLTRNRPLPTLEKKSVVAKREALAAKKPKKKGRPNS